MSKPSFNLKLLIVFVLNLLITCNACERLLVISLLTDWITCSYSNSVLLSVNLLKFVPYKLLVTNNFRFSLVALFLTLFKCSWTSCFALKIFAGLCVSELIIADFSFLNVPSFNLLNNSGAPARDTSRLYLSTSDLNWSTLSLVPSEFNLLLNSFFLLLSITWLITFLVKSIADFKGLIFVSILITLSIVFAFDNSFNNLNFQYFLY
ncbi:hypothetical protein RRG55_04300 [Mycoplasmopsis felis]|uniref:hypothetical protein n=1 Tax=Mycoplasmopsis felis TaxID=33923 RepID=UPI002AFF5A42|nr:hypothetical protein [Mycoplasmopsis felis]WQQ04262.1 hypothetical protein RRG47_01680 [Mycoplasmopsis felis]